PAHSSAAAGVAVLRRVAGGGGVVACRGGPGPIGGSGGAGFINRIGGFLAVGRAAAAGAGAVQPDAAGGEQHGQDAAADDGRVGQVEHGPVREFDPVHDVAAEQAGVAEDPVD